MAYKVGTALEKIEFQGQPDAQGRSGRGEATFKISTAVMPSFPVTISFDATGDRTDAIGDAYRALYEFSHGLHQSLAAWAPKGTSAE